jgi:hypothetical protein
MNISEVLLYFLFFSLVTHSFTRTQACKPKSLSYLIYADASLGVLWNGRLDSLDCLASPAESASLTG